MPLDYETFMKHAAHVVKTANTDKYPILAGVYHHPDGSLIVTDARRAYHASVTDPRKESDVAITPSGKRLIGDYPMKSLDRFTKHLYVRRTHQLDLPEFLSAVDMLYNIGKLAANNTLVFYKNKIVFEDIEISGSYEFNLPEDHLFGTIKVNAQFLYEALKLFKAAGCQTVTMNFFERRKPLLFLNETHDVKALIMPIA